MTTKLDKPVKRIIRLYNIDAERPVVVTLYPDGTLGFREKGRQKEYFVSLSSCWWLAVKQAAEELRGGK